MFYFSALTDIGNSKKTNQDSYLIRSFSSFLGPLLFAVVCDGMGGLDQGEIASASLVEHCSKWLKERLEPVLEQGLSSKLLESEWNDLIRGANKKIMDYGRSLGTNLGTTISLLLLFQGHYYIANIGDSRIYIFDPSLRLLTKDHSVVASLIERGEITEAEAKVHLQRSVLLQCIGVSEEINVDFFTGPYPAGSVFLCCSDGFRHEVSEAELNSYLDPSRLGTLESLDQALFDLVELVKSRHERDNITGLLVAGT